MTMVMISSMNMKLQNSDVLANLEGKLDHLSDNVQCELKQLIHERGRYFS